VEKNQKRLHNGNPHGGENRGQDREKGLGKGGSKPKRKDIPMITDQTKGRGGTLGEGGLRKGKKEK